MKELCHELAVALFDKYDEPIPPFETHDGAKLQAILANPQQTFDSMELYRTLEEKAAILYYGLIKGHAFENGNKRIATASLLVFLMRNGMWIECPLNELYAKALATAESNAKEKDRIFAGLVSWIRQRICTFE